MALKNAIDTDKARDALQDWLARRLPEARGLVVPAVHVHPESGISAETLVFEAEWQETWTQHRRGFVARVQPRSGGVFETYDLEPEFRLMRALHQHTAVPVPEALWLEQDDTVLGAPFLVMERLDGRVARDDPPFTVTGWVLALSAEQQAALYDNGLRALAAIHDVDVDRLDLAFAAEGVMGSRTVEQTLSRWRRFFDWSTEGEPNPTIETAFDWLSANIPPEPSRLAISWGDARLGNMIFADDLSVAGVIDWELMSLADPEMDLAWWLFLLRHHTEGIGAPLPPGFPDARATIDRYAELTGRVPENLPYYEVLAALRLSVAMVRAAKIMIENGQLPPDTAMAHTNPAAQLLARLMDLPAPTGNRQTFIGNRG